MLNRNISQKSPLRYTTEQKPMYTTQRHKLQNHNQSNQLNQYRNVNTTKNPFPVNTNNYQPPHQLNYQPPHQLNYQPNYQPNHQVNKTNQIKLNESELNRLTRGVFETFKQNYINYTPSYEEIYSIIKKNPPRLINQDSVLKIVQFVREYYQEKENKQIPFKDPVKPQFKQDDEVKPSNVSVHYVPDKPNNISQVVPSNRILEDNDNEIAQPPPKNGFVLTHEPKELMSQSIDFWEYYVIIDSKDRDIERFPSPNNYVIDFAPTDYTTGNERKGYIRRAFHNVMSIELISCLFLNSSSQPDASDTVAPPSYVMLEIPELSGDIHGTNTGLSNSFDVLTTYTTQGNYKYYNLPNNGGPATMIKNYEPRISINRLTIKFLLPSGELYQFGESNNTNTNTVNQIILKIKQKKHSFNTSFLHKENS